MSTDASKQPLFPYERWEPLADELREKFRAAAPFAHLHLERFLDPAVAERAAAAFPAPDSREWINYKHYNENKLGLSKRERFPDYLGALVDELNSPRFVAWLSETTGIEGLRTDPSLLGGGLHQTARGGFLNIHADFTRHHYRPAWRRQLNLILYLNPGWEDRWGGALEIWNEDMSACVERIPPLLNHAVLFNTTEKSYHGHPHPLTCPEGTTRKSVALYYYTDEPDSAYRPRPTDYQPLPSDGPIKRALIWLDKKLLSLYTFLKRRLGISEDFASRLLGFLSRDKKR